MAELNERVAFVEPELDGRIGLVTGANKGIGLATLHELGAAGMKVVGTSTSETGAEFITNTLAENGFAGFGVVLDFNETSGEDELDGWVRILEERCEGDATVLVNNAGITEDGLLVAKAQDKWDKAVRVNYTGPAFLTRAILGHRKKGGMLRAGYGSIVDNSSVIPRLISGGQTRYASTKAAMEAFMRQVAGEYAKYNIRANIVAPGGVDTDMTRSLQTARLQQIIDHTPMGRLGKPEEVARVIRFLASPAASFITGATLNVNGGMLG